VNNLLRNRIVLLNAPKGAGKDTIGAALAQLTGCSLRSFKSSLYDCAYPFTDCPSYDLFITLCTGRESKERNSSYFHDMSPRAFLIHISENITKPFFGHGFFGEKSAKSITNTAFESGVVFTDSGFEEEVHPLVKEFGEGNLCVVQFVGQGSEDFSGDSRDFISVNGVMTIKMKEKNENMTPKEFAELILKEIKKNDRS